MVGGRNSWNRDWCEFECKPAILFFSFCRFFICFCIVFFCSICPPFCRLLTWIKALQRDSRQKKSKKSHSLMIMLIPDTLCLLLVIWIINQPTDMYYLEHKYISKISIGHNINLGFMKKHSYHVKYLVLLPRTSTTT